MKRSKIAWTDYSGGDLGFVIGCSPVSAGCQNCYVAAWAKRAGRDFDQVTTYPDKLRRLEKAQWMHKGALDRGQAKPMCFVCNMGDLFHPDVPTSFIDDALHVMAVRSDVDWQVLTKRPERMHEVVSDWCWEVQGSLPSNIWLGVTAENQAAADERIPILLGTPAKLRWVSVEPMLGPVDIAAYLKRCPECGGSGYIRYGPTEGEFCGCMGEKALDWVVCGAESGPRHRPFEVEWAASLYAQCRDAGVPFFGKQASGVKPGLPLYLDGQMFHEWPVGRWARERG